MCYTVAMVELDNHSPDVNTLDFSDGDTPDDGGDFKSPRLSRKMIFLVLLTLAAVAVIVILALIGPVAGGDISIVLSL
jgi:hypothetical protein